MKLQINLMISKLSIFFISVLFMLHSSLASSDNSKLIPRRILFDNPDKTGVKLSPDGKYISYIAPHEGVMNIFVALSESPADAKPVTFEKTRGIRSYHWSYDNDHILYGQDHEGDENFRIYSYSISNHSTDTLTPEKGVKAFVYKMSHKFPNEIIVGTNERDQHYFDLYRINLSNKNTQLILENNRFSEFTLDNDLNVRFAEIVDSEGNKDILRFQNNNWNNFIKVPAEDALTTGIYGFSKNNDIIYMLDSRERNTGVLKAWNLSDDSSCVVAEDSKVDVDIFTIHPTEYIIQGVTINYKKEEHKIIDDAIKDDIKYLETIQNAELHIINRTLKDDMWLVAYSSDTAPVKYYKYDRKSKKADYLFSNRKNLEQYKLNQMMPLVIKSRDGLDLISYLTLPEGISLDDQQKKGQLLPLVIDVHGGPAVRDSWGLDATHQWLSNRGYAVLSINYRGSAGFGKDFLNAGDMQWGKKMHDDLIDVANWAINNNIADAKKIAIMGGSYGGYATLVGLTTTADFFACGIDMVGPSNLYTLIQSIPPYWKPILGQLKKKIGPWDTPEQREALAQISPLTHVDKIKKPLFIAQGAHDPRVKQAESDQIVKAMEAKNIPVIYALYNDEGHGLARPENKLSYFAMIEQFLAKILGGKVEAINDDFKGANFLLNGKEPNNQLAEELINKMLISQPK